jgi:hypothetical protein
MNTPLALPQGARHGQAPVLAQKALAPLGWLCALALTMAGCAAGPDPTDRAPTAADAYIQQVEQQARTAVSPTQVIWAHPPRGGTTRAAGTRTWNWSAPVPTAEPSAAEDDGEPGGAASDMGSDSRKDPGGLRGGD